MNAWVCVSHFIQLCLTSVAPSAASFIRCCTVGEDEDHPHAGLMEILGALIESYEDRHVPECEGDSLTTLRLLMADHGLTAADLPELGDAAQVAATLSGTVALTPTQIRRLAQRFHVAPATFR